MTIQNIEISCRPQTENTVSVGGQVCLEINMPTNGYYQEWLDALLPFDSDESAATGGIAVGKWYVTSDNFMGMPGGVPKKRLF